MRRQLHSSILWVDAKSIDQLQPNPKRFTEVRHTHKHTCIRINQVPTLCLFLPSQTANNIPDIQRRYQLDQQFLNLVLREISQPPFLMPSSTLVLRPVPHTREEGSDQNRDTSRMSQSQSQTDQKLTLTAMI